MASPGLELAAEGQPQPEPAFGEAQKWIEQVTGRSFGEKDFRSGLENGILLCELLNAIKPGLIKKINRLPTPIAGLVPPCGCCLGRSACGALGERSCVLAGTPACHANETVPFCHASCQCPAAFPSSPGEVCQVGPRHRARFPCWPGWQQPTCEVL
uniref:LIM and calponin homology domains 1 n=1 Tax=Anser cygnoides TaxID=8845 RepID=A0A8B9D3F8_ANSCY